MVFAMAVQPKVGSGSTARTVHTVRDATPRSTRRGRPPKQENASPPSQFQSEYEKSRVEEISARAALYRLKLRKLTGELLDRKLVMIEFTAMFTSIREIILGSKLSHCEKTDLLHSLSEIPVVLVSRDEVGK
jgi:hypothetical protein